MARKINKKQTLFKVAIVGEGDTEWFYFNNMRQYEKFSFKVEPELPKHSDYKTIIKTARKKRNEGYDLVFCVLDLDRIVINGKERDGYKAEKSKINLNKSIHFIETMPCIELWFLLHFLDDFSAKIYMNYSQVVAPLKKHISGYEKKQKFFQSINIYEYLLSHGDIDKATMYSERLMIEKKLSDNPLFNFSQIHEIIAKLKDR